MRQPTKILSPSELEVYADSWRVALEAEGRPHTTRRVYLLAVRKLDEYLASRGMPTGLSAITAEHVREWQRELLSRCAPGSVRLYHAALRAFFNWAVREGEVKASPLATVKPPSLPETPVRVLTLEELTALVAICEKDDSFAGRRDAALVRFLVDTGCRLAEVTGLKRDAIDMRTGIVQVMGKGHRPRLVHLRPRTLRAVDRYLRRRAFQTHADVPPLWLSRTGPLTKSGIAQIIKRRAIQAGIGADVHAHLLRHAFANEWLRAGGSEGNLMALGGWRSTTVMRRYAAAAAAERALEAHAQMEEKL